MLIALGVTGGIGAYKAVEVARGLQKRGHDVVAIMTATATRFVGPITFEAITRHRVITDQFEPGANADIEHIALASTIDLLLIAPATANIIGKLANGIADDFLSTLYTATRAPVMLAPSMNTQMFSHEAIRHNLDTLAARGVGFIEPGEGYLACGWIGKGRLAEPDEIVAAVEARLMPSGPLKSMRVLVTAGPTLEDIDPVRFVGNRSSGRMGFALASEASRRGARVTLIAGPTSVEPPAVAELVRVRSAADMHRAVLEKADSADVVIMAAAVADYTPEKRADQKIHKTDPDDDPRDETDAGHSGRPRDATAGVRAWTVAGGICGGDRGPRGDGLPRSSARSTSTSSWRTMCRGVTPASTWTPTP